MVNVPLADFTNIPKNFDLIFAKERFFIAEPQVTTASSVAWVLSIRGKKAHTFQKNPCNQVYPSQGYTIDELFCDKSFQIEP